MRKAAKAKAIIELAVPVPLDNIEDFAPSHEETFGIGPVSSPEDTPEEPEPLNEEENNIITHRIAQLALLIYHNKGKSQDLFPWQLFPHISFLVLVKYNPYFDDSMP